MSEIQLIDVTQKKTEVEWQAALDQFWLAATPKLFDWYKWAACLTGIEMVKERNPNWVILGIYSFSYFALMSYFYAFFFQFHFKIAGDNSRSDKWHRNISICLSGLLAVVTFYTVTLITNSIRTHN